MASPVAKGARIPLGVVVRAHGLRGELRVKSFNTESTLLGERKSVLLRKDGAEREIEIRAARGGGEAWLLVVDGVTTRDEADALRGWELCVPRSELPALAPGEWYLVDAIGLRVERADGTQVGEVVDIVEYPASRCLAVRADDGVREVPLRAPYFVSMDVEGGRVVVDAFEDLELVAEKTKPKAKAKQKPSPA